MVELHDDKGRFCLLFWRVIKCRRKRFVGAGFVDTYYVENVGFG